MRKQFLSLALWVLVFASPLTGHACSCVFSGSTGFVHAGKDIRLPSNAKGVLFLADEADLWRDVTPASFQMLRQADQKPIPVEVKRLDMAAQMGRPQNGSMNSEARNGLFRVGPSAGFEVGKTYTIRFTDGTRRVSRSESSITFTVDSPISIASPRDFALVKVGAPTGRLMNFAAGGTCHEERGVLAQELQYSIPDAYKPYSNFLLQFTDYRKRTESTKSETAFEPWGYHPSMCADKGYGKSFFGPTKEVMLGSCATPSGNKTVVEVQGYVGFLEVEDNLHAMPIVEIDFSQATRSECSRHRFLVDVVNSASQGRISDYVCSIAQDKAEIVPMSGPFLASLADLTKSRDARSSSCAIEAIFKGTLWPEKMEPGADEVLAEVIAANPRETCRLGKEQGSLRSYAPKLQALAPALLKILTMLSKDSDKEIRGCARYAIRSLVERVQKLDSQTTKVLFDLYLSWMVEAQGQDDRRQAEGQFERLLRHIKFDRAAARPVLLEIANIATTEVLRCDAIYGLADEDRRMFPDDDASLEVLATNLSMPHDNNRSFASARLCAAEALAFTGERGKTLVPRLLDMMDQNLDSREYNHVIRVLELMKADEKTLVNAYQRAAKSSDENVRYAADRELRWIERRKKKASESTQGR